MRTDGTGIRRLPTPFAHDTVQAALSLDGKRLAFVRGSNRELYVIKADGTGLRGIASSALFPAWSPDGSRIAFTREQGTALDIYVVNPDGSGERKLASNGVFPAWSPNGDSVAFASVSIEGRDLFIMNADGSALRRLTEGPLLALYPAWSPDGKVIAFTGFTADHRIDIYSVSVERGAIRRLGHGASAARATSAGKGFSILTDLSAPPASVEPRWSLDGKKIAFISVGSNNASAIYVMSADGSDATELVSLPSTAWLTWSTAPPP